MRVSSTSALRQDTIVMSKPVIEYRISMRGFLCLKMGTMRSDRA
jgi:hypothetical protein